MYTIVCAVSAKNHPQILRSQVEQSRAADFCCDKETGAANTWAVLARRMMQSRRKSVPPDLLRVILLWHSDAACRPAGFRLRKRCRHFAVPSPLGAPYASCRVYQTPEAFFASGVSVFRAGVLPDADAACRPAGFRLRKRCRHFAVPSPLGAPYASCRVYHTPAVFTAGAFFPSAGVLPDADAFTPQKILRIFCGDPGKHCMRIIHSRC